MTGLFLCHNSLDKPLVAPLAAALRDAGLAVWYDEATIAPGDDWLRRIESGLTTSTCVAVCLGPHGLGPVQREELSSALAAALYDDVRRVVPVLLPGATREHIPHLLRHRSFVDLTRFHPQDGPAPPQLARLIELAGLEATHPSTLAPGENPYRALDPFRAEHADRFFGRGEVTAELLDHLKTGVRTHHRLLALVGASGAGKSSLVMAGLIPALLQDGLGDGRAWRVATVRVGDDPGGALANAVLKALDTTDAALPNLLRQPTDIAPDRPGVADALADFVAQKLPAEGDRLLVFVDQAEELFAKLDEKGSDYKALARTFFAHLLRLTRVEHGAVTVVLTLRADHLHRFLEDGEVEAAIRHGLYVLGALTPEGLQTAIERPARRAGRTFAPGLVDALVKAVREEPGHLPLLQFALHQLWEKEDGPELTWATYRNIGQVEGAIALHADRVLRELDPAAILRARRLLEALIHLGEGAADTRRRLPLAELGADPTVLKHLVDGRLLTTSDTEVEVAHEALIRQWQTLRGWVDESRAKLRLLREAETAAKAWTAAEPQHKAEYLWRGGRLDNLEEHLAETSPIIPAFAQASRRALRRARRVRMTIVAMFFGALAISALVVFIQWRQAEGQRAEAEHQRLVAQDRLDRGINTVNRIGFKVQEELNTSRDVPRLRASLLKEMGLLLKALDPDGNHGDASAQEAKRLDTLGDAAREAGKLDEARMQYEASMAIRKRLAEADPSNAEWQRDLSMSHNSLGDLALATGDLAGARAQYETSLTIRKRLAEADPNNAERQGDLAVSHGNLGHLSVATGNLAGARIQNEAALAIHKRLAEADPSNAGWQRELSVSHERLGNLILATGDLAGARTQYEESMAIAKRLAEVDPSNAGWQRDLSVSYSKLGKLAVATGDLAGARTQYEASLAIAKRLAEADPSSSVWQHDLSVSHIHLGELAQATDDLAGSHRQYEASRSILERLAEADPNNAGWQRDLSVSHSKLGELAQATGDLAGARGQYEASHSILERLAKADPSNAGWQRDLSVSHTKLGELAQATGDLAGARGQYEASQYILERLAKADPSNAGWQRDLSVIHRKLGELAKATGDLAGARTQYEASQAIAKRLAEADPSNKELQRDLSSGHLRLGDLALDTGILGSARAQYEASQAIAKQHAEADPSNAGWQSDLMASLQRVAFVEAQAGRMPEARSRLAEALAILDRLLAQAEGGETVKLALQTRLLATQIESQAGNAAAAATHRAEAKRLLAILDARGEFQGDAQLDQIRATLKDTP